MHNFPFIFNKGVLVNEIWGILEENATTTYVEQKLKQDFCSRLSGEFRLLCDGLVNLVPFFLTQMADRSTSSVGKKKKKKFIKKKKKFLHFFFF